MPQNFAASGLWELINNKNILEASHWPNLFSNESNELLFDALAFVAVFDDHKSDGYFALELLNLRNNCCFRDRGVRD
jgi:hypothetical protein